MGFLPIVIWHLVILGYLLSKRAKSRQTWLLTSWLASLTLLMVCNFLGRAIYAPMGGYIFWIGGILSALVALTLELQFAYRFPRAIYAREARVVLLFSVVSTVGLAILMIAEAVASPGQASYNFEQFIYGFFDLRTGQNTTSNAIFNIIHPLGHLWAPVVWLRRLFNQSALDRTDSAKSCPRWIWDAFWQPRGKECRVARDFALLMTAAVVAALVEILESLHIVPLGSFSTLYALILFGIILTYINNSPEPSTFIVKLVGISLVTLLIVWGIVSPLILNEYRQSYEKMRMSELAHVKTLIENQALSSGQVPPQVLYILKRPTAGELFPKGEYHLLFSSVDGLDAQALAQQDARLRAELIQNRPSAQIAVMSENPWIKNIPTADMSGDSLDQLSIPENAQGFRGTYTSTEHHYIRYYVSSPSEETSYEIGYGYPDYRLMLHRKAMPLVYLTVTTLLAILFVFPRFFHASLVRPLNDLLEGVARFNAGELSAEVPAHVEDEIGFLAHSFNAMVHSRRQAEAEVRESEARFRALFEHAPLCIFEVDMSQAVPTIVHANRQAERVYGWPLAALGGSSLDKLIPPQAIADVARVLDALLAGKTITLESVSQRRDGSLFPVRVSAAPEVAPGLSQVILIIEDITVETDRRSEEAAIAEERRRIAREIHDGLAQDLASLRLRADVWHALLDRDPAKLHTELDRLQDILTENIHEVRRAIFALRPAALEELGFYPALHRFIEDLGKHSQLYIDLRISRSQDRLPASLEPVLFRIIQETLNNVSKHARADTVWIELDLQSTDEIILHARDNGVGFDVAGLDQAIQRGHLGLKQMRERVENLQGTFTLHSQPGQGTEIHITLPLLKS